MIFVLTRFLLDFRSYEYILIAFFAYTAVLALVLPVSQTVTIVTLTMNILVVGGLAFLAYAESLRRRELLSIMRHWFPVILSIFAYREMGWFAQPALNTELEDSWIVLDKLLLNEWGLKAVIESLGPLLPSVLEISYSLVYTMPLIALVILYIVKRSDRANAFLFNFLLGVLFVYAPLPIFPLRAALDRFSRARFPSLQYYF